MNSTLKSILGISSFLSIIFLNTISVHSVTHNLTKQQKSLNNLENLQAQKTLKQHSSIWEKMPGSARDVGDGWVIGTNRTGGGYGIYRWNGSTWEEIYGGGIRIGGNRNNPWVVNDKNEIYRWDGSTWEKMPGSARDVGDGWVIGTNRTGGGYGIYRWNGSTWEEIYGGGIGIAGNINIPWVVNDKNEIYRK